MAHRKSLVRTNRSLPDLSPSVPRPSIGSHPDRSPRSLFRSANWSQTIGKKEKKINGKFSTNRVFAYRKIYLFQPTFYVAGIKILYYRNARVYTNVYIYIYIHTGSWNNMVYLQWNDSHLINCFAMLQWNSKSGKLSIFVTNSYCSLPPFVHLSTFQNTSPLPFSIRIRSRVYP